MEPVRGGKLAKLSNENEALLKQMRPDEKIPAWAFRFLQSIPEVKVILSGMSNFEQMKDNIHTFETNKPLTDDEMATLLNMAEKMLTINTVACTGCRYCTSHCPQQLDIPSLIELYNEHSFTGGGFLAPFALMAIPKEKHPDACISCRSCEAVCPQQIKISEVFNKFTEILK